MWLILEVLKLVVVDIDLVCLILSLLLLLLAVLFLRILVVVGCFSDMPEELGGHGLRTIHLLLVGLLLAARVLILVLDPALDS